MKSMSWQYLLECVVPLGAWRRSGACLTVALALTGCALGGVAGKGLEMVGLKKPEPTPEMKAALMKLQAQGEVTLRIHAAQRINVDSNGRSLSLVTRVYKLRSAAQFTKATYRMFDSTEESRPAFHADVLSVQEIVLKPGEKYEVIEVMPPEASHLAVVGLFRMADPHRWRFVFEARPAAESGVTLGAHGCALSVSQGTPVGAPPEALRLAGAQCR